MTADNPSTYHQEMQRRANDLLRVKNPLNQDYVVEYDRANGVKQFIVPAKGEAVHLRYIAEKYIKELYQKILNERAARKVAEENTRRRESGMAEMDKTLRSGEQMQFESPLLNPDTEEKRRIISMLYVGVENEYGVVSKQTGEQEESPQSFDDLLEDVQESVDRGSYTPTSTEENASQSESGEEDSLENDAQEDKFACSHCDFTTTHKIALVSHEKTHDKSVDRKEEVVQGVSA